MTKLWHISTYRWRFYSQTQCIIICLKSKEAFKRIKPIQPCNCIPSLISPFLSMVLQTNNLCNATLQCALTAYMSVYCWGYFLLIKAIHTHFMVCQLPSMEIRWNMKVIYWSVLTDLTCEPVNKIHKWKTENVCVSVCVCVCVRVYTYSFLTKAYLLIVSMTSLKRILDVRV